MKITSGRWLVEVVDGRFGALGAVDVDVVFFQGAGEKQARGLGVVDDQRALCAHAPLHSVR